MDFRNKFKKQYNVMKDWFKMVLSFIEKFLDEVNPHGWHLSAAPPLTRWLWPCNTVKFVKVFTCKRFQLYGKSKLQVCKGLKQKIGLVCFRISKGSIFWVVLGFIQVLMGCLRS